MEFKVVRNDISKMRVDVVVLPANRRLIVGTGSSLALFEAAGRRQLEAECAMRYEEAVRQGIRLVPGVSILTNAYALPARGIMHTIVPKWRKDRPRQCYEDLCKSYASALVLADEGGFVSIAFPILASGNNGFDPDLAIDIAVQSLTRYQPKNKLAEAYLVTFGGSVTQKMRDRGFEVEESIDEVHVADQGLHQAKVVKRDEHWDERWKAPEAPKTPGLFDDLMKWMTNPQNMKEVLRFAVGVADVVLPAVGAPEEALKVLDVIAPIAKGRRDRRGSPRR